jgi:type VI protein secretion system component VasK
MAFKRVIIWRVGPLFWLLGLKAMHVDLGQVAPIFLLLFVGYLYCSVKLYKIIMAEHPEWLAYQKGREMLYLSFPKVLNALTIQRVLAIAFSARASQLKASKGYIYSIALRVIIVSAMLLFFGVFIFPYI